MRTQQPAIWNTAAAAEVATTAAPSQSVLHIFGGVVSSPLDGNILASVVALQMQALSATNFENTRLGNYA